MTSIHSYRNLLHKVHKFLALVTTALRIINLNNMQKCISATKYSDFGFCACSVLQFIYLQKVSIVYIKNLAYIRCYMFIIIACQTLYIRTKINPDSNN